MLFPAARKPALAAVLSIECLGGCQPAAMSPAGRPSDEVLAPAATLVAAGDQALLHDRGGRLWEWGLHSLATAQAPRPARARPVPMTALGPVKGVAASEDDGRVGAATHVLAVKTDGTVWSWGANHLGQGGHGAAGSEAPLQVAGLTGVSAVEAGSGFSLALKADGTVWAWGHNATGQLGDGGQASRALPAPVPGLADVALVRAGRRHVVALTRDGRAWTWGANEAGQLGTPVAADAARAAELRRASPAAIPGLANVVEVAASAEYSLARLADGQVVGWGRARHGVLGALPAGTSVVAAPVAVPGATGVRALAAGRSHVLALLGDGRVMSWGGNDLGELGRGTAGFGLVDAVPREVPGLGDVVAIAAGRHYSLALDRLGQVWAWGSNYGGHGGRGQVGHDGTVKPTLVLAPAGDGAWKVGE